MIYDLIVVGSGVAGLTAALQANDKKVLVITKTDKFSSGSSPLAQGGIAASVGKNDSSKLHYKDTVEAGVFSGLSNAISFLTEEGESAIKSLQKINMSFDVDDKGNLDLNKEGAHSRRRVLKAGGDATGRVLVETLYHEALKRENIIWRSETFVWDLIINNGCINGIIAYSKDKGWEKILSTRVLLATGGLGQLFGHTTNPVEATGDSMAIALRSGLKLKDLEMVQFHPTALNIKSGSSLRLLTEALRGDGGILVREDGIPFMGKYSPKKDLAPRDVVARGIWQEMSCGHRVFLDLKNIDDIKTKFPTVTSFCLKAGLNPRRDLIPITPAVHYVMGGVDINSDMPYGLAVAGEAAYTGVHGANRLASNSLLECLVYGKSQAKKLLDSNNINLNEKNIQSHLYMTSISIPDYMISQDFKHKIQDIMYKYCGIIRNENDLSRGKDLLLNIKDEIDSFNCKSEKHNGYREVVNWLEVKNMVILGIKVIESAIYRKESRGAHYREDYPDKDNKWNRIKLGD